MKKHVILIVFALSVLLILQGCYQKAEKSRACFSQNCFNAEIANTPESREKGLMFRQSLDNNSGMLFVFDNEGVYTFWMKNTLIPLDMIWIDSNYSVVFIARNASPCKTEQCPITNPGRNALYVLEINSGEIDKLGLREGDKAVMQKFI